MKQTQNQTVTHPPLTVEISARYRAIADFFAAIAQVSEISSFDPLDYEELHAKFVVDYIQFQELLQNLIGLQTRLIEKDDNKYSLQTLTQLINHLQETERNYLHQRIEELEAKKTCPPTKKT